MTAATEIWLAVGYAAFLLAVSSALKRLARRTARGPRAWFGRLTQGERVPDQDAPWPHSDAARFERGLASVLRVLAVFILAVTVVRHPLASPALGALLLAMAAQRRGLLPRLWYALRRKKDSRVREP